jgi:hypothetical protein
MHQFTKREMAAKDIRVFGDEVVDVIDGSPEQV